VAARYWLQIPEIKGESADRDHDGWIDVESYSPGMTRSGMTGSGVSVGKTGGEHEKLTVEDFHFTKKADKASPKLAEAVARGLTFPKAKLEARQLGSAPGAFLPGMRGWLQVKVLTYEFEDAMVTSYRSSPGAGDATPIDIFALSFKKMTYKYS
jgi:type VI secretion system secreted protein Hcp